MVFVHKYLLHLNSHDFVEVLGQLKYVLFQLHPRVLIAVQTSGKVDEKITLFFIFCCHYSHCLK